MGTGRNYGMFEFWTMWMALDKWGGFGNELCRLLPPRARCPSVGNYLRFPCADQLSRELYLFAGRVGKKRKCFCLR